MLHAKKSFVRALRTALFVAGCGASACGGAGEGGTVAGGDGSVAGHATLFVRGDYSQGYWGVPAFRMNLSDIEGTYGAGCRIHAGEGWALYVGGKNPLPAPAPELARGDSISGCRLTLTGMRGQLGIGGKPYDIPLSAPIPLSRAYQTQAVTTTVSGLAEARHFSGLSDDRGGRQQRDSGQALEGPPSPSASLAATSGPAPPGPLPAPSVSARKIRIL